MKKLQVFLINDTGKLDNDTQSKKEKSIDISYHMRNYSKWITALM